MQCICDVCYFEFKYVISNDDIVYYDFICHSYMKITLILYFCRCSIVAAANPSGGHYNKAKTVCENLRMGGALLSRFDLVYILLDTPNEQRDKSVVFIYLAKLTALLTHKSRFSVMNVM